MTLLEKIDQYKALLDRKDELADLTKDGTLKTISEKYFKSDITCK